MEMITEGWKDEQVKSDFGKRILSSDFLVIDDVGREYKTRSGFIENQFDMIFRIRTNALLPTILTSNLAPANIATDFGKRLISILYEHLIIVETNGKDYRKVIARKNAKETKESKEATKD